MIATQREVLLGDSFSLLLSSLFCLDVDFAKAPITVDDWLGVQEA